ncbi:hypothetical protein [Frankia sp. R43]|nr:hypothetical protein [Frankia sp. R43]
MGLAVVARDPLADEFFELVEEVERLLLDVDAPVVDVRALVTG